MEAARAELEATQVRTEAAQAKADAADARVDAAREEAEAAWADLSEEAKGAWLAKLDAATPSLGDDDRACADDEATRDPEDVL